MTRLCAVLNTSLRTRSLLMSFGGLCSAWSVSHRLHLDYPLEDFNLHHTPCWLTLLFLSKCFHRHHPVGNPPRFSLRTDSRGESDGSALSFQKAKYEFQFFYECVSSVYCGCELWRGDAVSELLTQWRAHSDPICQARQSYPFSFCQSLPIMPVSRRCTIIIEHEMLLAS